MKPHAYLSLLACLGLPIAHQLPGDDCGQAQFPATPSVPEVQAWFGQATWRDEAPAMPLPCTTFSFKVGDQILFGRNYDWSIGSGFVTVNKRGLSKAALNPGTTDALARWESRFGSVTFNQYGREFSAGGINEAGLVVETMWLRGTRYPAPDQRPALPEIMWIQYQLDTASTVDDVIASHAELRILTRSSGPIHFLVCDKTGATATIEFLDGELVVHRGDELPFTALANSRYSKSVGYLKLHEGFGGAEPLEQTQGSLDRFCRAVDSIQSYSGKAGAAAVQHAFSILKDVSQGRHTQWSIVYDIKNMRVHFKTAESPAVKFLDLASCDFSSRTPCAVLDIQTAKPGDVSGRFTEYTTEINRKQVYHAFRKTMWPNELSFLKDLPDEILDRVAEYPSIIDQATQRALAGVKDGK